MGGSGYNDENISAVTDMSDSKGKCAVTPDIFSWNAMLKRALRDKLRMKLHAYHRSNHNFTRVPPL